MPIQISMPVKPEPEEITRIVKEMARRSTDATIDKIVKHVLANSADSTAIANTTTETNFSLNTSVSTVIWRVGGIIRLTASGVYSTTGTPTLTFRVKLGSTNLVVFTAKTGINNASNASWRLEAEIVCRSIGSSGTVMASGTRAGEYQQAS